MGYYSEVLYEILKEDEPKLLKLAEEDDAVKFELEFANHYNHQDEYWDEETQKFVKVDTVIYHWESNKWYYDGPEHIDKLLQSLDKYVYIEIGEEVTDITYKSKELYGSDINVHRYIEVDNP